jgi:hypothetical protein
MKLLPSLLAGLKAVCAAFPDPRKWRGSNIAMADFGLSAFAMFFVQSASFLSFQRALEKGQGRSNCQSLFGIEKIPSDNYIRDMLDEADPALLLRKHPLGAAGVPGCARSANHACEGQASPINGTMETVFVSLAKDERSARRAGLQAARSIRVECQFHGSSAARSLIL